jgi:sucrose-6-phosphate hydrolase SacC (GH32 family)
MVQPTYQEPFRPQFHFTPERNWMNDPNGLVYYDGQYHLFYQYNPFGDKWGHMSWGHAVSSDLVHWKHLPLALSEQGEIMIFSGSAVIDFANTSGFGRDDQPPMVAIYTGHREERRQTKRVEDQRLAYSNDRGRTWTHYPSNPVINIGSPAAVTWSNAPETDGRRILLGWMSNWDYTQDVPTAPWRGAMIVPRSLALKRRSKGLRLAQKPVDELEKLREEPSLLFPGGFLF